MLLILILLTILTIFVLYWTLFLDYCLDSNFKTNEIEGYPGREECNCKPIAECKWTQQVQKLSDKLPKRNKLRKRVIQLLRDSICDFETKTIHCCNGDGVEEDLSIGGQIQMPRQTMVWYKNSFENLEIILSTICKFDK